MALFSQLEDAEKLESGTFVLYETKSEIRRLLWNVIKANKTTAFKQNITLESEVDP